MCGIIAAATDKSVTPFLLQGLKRLEYRGYDSAGIGVLGHQGELQVVKEAGKVDALKQRLQQQPTDGLSGIGHTRWATHGEPSAVNAHPQLSHDSVAIVHNGIIENYKELQQQLIKRGITFLSQTDSEVIAHLVWCEIQAGASLIEALQHTAKKLHGSFAIAAIASDNNYQIAGVCYDCPLVIGISNQGLFLCSDPHGLHELTEHLVYMEQGQSVLLEQNHYQLYSHQDTPINAKEVDAKEAIYTVETTKGDYAHFMQKEMFEQPEMLSRILARCVDGELIKPDLFLTQSVLSDIQGLHIIACGSSYHAGLVAKYWLEELVGLPCSVEVASEFRYRTHAVPPNCLMVNISQSGETADTLAALRSPSRQSYLTDLALVNVAYSTLVREANHFFLLDAGPEIGVASTKALTAQMVALFIFTLSLAQNHPSATVSPDVIQRLLKELANLPRYLNEILQQEQTFKNLATQIKDNQHVLFLGRGLLYPIAMEGALKLKEISYIHAEAYPAGELKHGPLALVDENMPVVALLQGGEVGQRMLANLRETATRGAQLIIVANADTVPQLNELQEVATLHVFPLPTLSKNNNHTDILDPFTHLLPMQLLAYHTALARGNDVDQPRNLAKSVTVE